MMNSLNEALKFLDMGIATIPILHREKRPSSRALISTGNSVIASSKSGRDYERGVWETFQRELPTADKLKTWFESGRNGLGVVMGWKNLTVIDFDNMPIYNIWSMWAKINGIPPTYKVKTGRGVHVYTFLTDKLGQTLKSPLGIDIKATGYVLAPPSIHPSGSLYSVLSADNICTYNNLESILPVDLFKVLVFQGSTGSAVDKVLGDWDLPNTYNNDVKNTVKILDFFPNAFQTGNGFYMAVCPLHNDKKPSFWIDTKKNRCGCHTHTCITGSYSSIDFYAQWKNLTIPAAIKEMKTL